MADPEPSIRQRKPIAASTEVDELVEPRKRKEKPPLAKTLDDEDAYSPYLDIVRVLTFLFLASCGLSYLISGGETWFWGMKNPPRYLQRDWWTAQIV
jgi:hypothetical protein